MKDNNKGYFYIDVLHYSTLIINYVIFQLILSSIYLSHEVFYLKNH
ncbi:hypothetical protein LCGC14_1494690 [marine sediment metagenome]|uniref:Uncharacterized protein n=1 Tax=marine sediment metagenome TaxID=412755 RepID=A0A0F9LL92_9ZZZZ